MASRWIGDLRTCFLHDDGWAFRVEVNSYQLAGREGWRLPLSFAQHVGLEECETRHLAPNRAELGETIWIATRSGICAGGSIDGPLHRLGATSGDLLFFTARSDRYGMTVRRQEELHDATPLQLLLWSCGLDPNDPAVLSEPWIRLARALGGSGSGGRDEVHRRLERRRDDRLLGVLEQAGRSRTEHLHAAGTAWPEDWQYCQPLADHTTLPALRGADQTIRVALGLLDATNQPPRGLVLGDGGLLWLHQSLVGDPDDVSGTFRTPPRGLVPAAHRTGWSRMIRVEHAARRLALAGDEWSVSAFEGGWHLRGRPYGALLDALAELEGTSGEDAVPAPTRGVQTPYPRSAVAHRSAAEQAVAAGLRAIVSDPSCGFRAEYVDRDVVAPALHEVLIAP